MARIEARARKHRVNLRFLSQIIEAEVGLNLSIPRPVVWWWGLKESRQAMHHRASFANVFPRDTATPTNHQPPTTNKLFLTPFLTRALHPTRRLHQLIAFARRASVPKYSHTYARMGKRNRTTTQDSVPAHPAPQNSKEIELEDGKKYTAVTEGLATVLFPKVTIKKDKSGKEVEVEGHVFYNPIQQFNRDMSVLAIKAFADIFLEEKRAKKEGRLRRNKEKGNGNSNVKLEDAETAKHEDKAKGGDKDNGDAKLAEEERAGWEDQPGPKPTLAVRTGDPMDIDPTRASIPPKFTILDALSATGLRALRYALEISSATSITANDLDPSATASITQNIDYNKSHSSTADPETLSPNAAMSKIRVSLANASHHMYATLSPVNPDPSTPIHLRGFVGKYEVIDLDPFGTAAPFFDAAVQAVSDGGLLCITCTDAGVWASTGYSEKAFALYGGITAKGEWSHEAGIRIILNAVAMSAARYGSWIEPLLSLSIDFYGRIFVRIRRGPEMVKRMASTTMIVYNCDEGCGSWVLQKLGKIKEEKAKSGNGTFYKFGLSRAPTTGTNCKECGFPMHLAGPMWAGPLHSSGFITHLLSTLPPAVNTTYATIPRITGMLQTALQESAVDSPFFFATTRLAKTLHCEAPSLAAFRGALKGLGYNVSRSHCKPTSIKTNAPWSVIWEVMRRWVKKKPIKEGGIGAKQAGYEILRIGRTEEAKSKGVELELTKEEEALAKLEVDFDEVLGIDVDKVSGIIRYQVNPTANWGPMARKKEGVLVKGEQPSAEAKKEIEEGVLVGVKEEETGVGKNKRESEELKDVEEPVEKKVK